MQTYGPGDIVGFDPRHVVRTEPPTYTPNFEPNYLAAIEFDEPDFPWLFTPAALAGDRMRPWLVLIVLTAAEYAACPGRPSRCRPSTSPRSRALQPLADSWNWAHTQVSGDGGLAATLAAAPGSVISRLICPRRLDPETSYTAFVVPAFEIGRLAGLGLGRRPAVHDQRPGVDAGDRRRRCGCRSTTASSSTPATRATSSRWSGG